MQKWSAVVALVLLCEVGHSYGDDRTEEPAVLRAQVERLTTQVARQDARIADLERKLTTLLAVVESPEAAPQRGVRKAAGPSSGWKNPANWRRIKDGMSHSQVTEILGSPTSSKFLTWYYEGYVAGIGEVSGNVGFLENRVMSTNMPVFE